jgi:hypothetical protein
MRTRVKKPQKPTISQTKILSRIAQSYLVKTQLPSRTTPVWQIDGGAEISDKDAKVLIQNGWLKPQRDGLSLFDESQTYRVLKAETS